MGEPQTFRPTIVLIQDEGVARITVKTEGLTVSFDIDAYELDHFAEELKHASWKVEEWG